MSEFKNIEPYITGQLKKEISDAIKLSLEVVTKAKPVNKLIERNTKASGISKILKKGFTP